jgi:C4-dicarboxylate-specific signal transduction histidine kinase
MCVTVGAFACSMQRERDWPQEVVQRLRLLADVFAVVLMRRRAGETVRRDREELAHALRCGDVGELAASLTHEINQPLAAIVSNAQAASRLLRSGDADAEVPAVLRDITDDAKRTAQIIRRLRVLFKRSTASASRSTSWKRRRIHLQLVLQPDPLRVRGDIVQLQQVMLKVLVNAAEAMTGDPRELHDRPRADRFKDRRSFAASGGRSASRAMRTS